MDALIVHEGITIDYTPDGDVAAGDVVALGDVGIGIAHEAIASGVMGSLHVDCVVDIPKTEREAINAFEWVYWVTSAGTADSTAGPSCGMCTLAAAADDTRVRVKLQQLPASQLS
jgi:predicted RecA/RadA family phage recombinase